MNIEQIVLRPNDRLLVALSRNSLGLPVHSTMNFEDLDSASRSAIDVILASAGRKLPEDVPVAVVAEIKQLETRLGELRASLQG